MLQIYLFESIKDIGQCCVVLLSTALQLLLVYLRSHLELRGEVRPVAVLYN